MTLRALPCAATESGRSRPFQLAASACAALGSVLIVGASLLNQLGFHHDRHPAASLVFALASLLLAVSCVASIRQPRRGAVFALAAVTALTLGFTDLGRGTSGITFTLSGVTHYVAGAALLVLLLGVVLLCTQIAASLARKNACNCG